ncbi:exopolysaccharide biosynthesis operon protein EpsL [Collimonas sp. OK242]|jgi:exopolysaccharide biosynthesis operon protein EpsL|uniref:XrtB/PEP-CTERM-associated polysaccharide biosynthesis outer membrane protein EpsL n=1 Tax=Collimonas sp. OK242 TaxID=1798195 RepID=UPI0008957C19|nr:XrtB/PEP-CTERM-associated polysaccharide biosynthesis outer membrane protein EpsL [Collimonas sp. OK242]SDY44713.1 exopolysaccharide biosynthesis operon protein EpsL [Collimonas sp. OK242]
MNQQINRRAKFFRLRWKTIFLIPMCSWVPVLAVANDLVPTDVIPPPDIITPTPDAIRPYASYGISYDDNLLGLENSAAAQAMGIGSNLSDYTRRLQLGLIADKTISQQHLTASVNVANVEYDRFRQLDHTDKNVAANWNWHAGPHVEGNAGVTYSQGLTPFIDFHLLEKNLRTQESAYVDGSWLFHPSWRVRGGLVHSKLSYDLASQQPANNTQNQTEVGLDYLAATGSTIGVQLRHTRANFPNPEQDAGLTVFNGYDQDEVKGKVDWLLSGKTKLHFLGGWVSRKQDAPSIRDFSGINSRVSADWSPTGKIDLTVAGWREIGAVDDLSTVYSVNHGASIASAWQYSEKIRFIAQFKYQKRDFSQTIASGTPGAPNQNDALRNTGLTMVYNPTQRWQVQLSGTRSTRALTNTPGGYVDNGVMLNTRYAY